MTDKILKLPFPIAADKPTMDGRVYPREILQAAVDSWQERIQEGRAWGEMNSSSDRVHLADVSHKIVGLKLEGDNVVATAEILPTDAGKVLADLEKGKVELEFNPVGRGDVDPEMGVISNYTLDHINIEAKPSVRKGDPRD